MRFLALSYYYPPDIGPGAFRSAAVVEALRDRLRPGDSLDVVAMQPHRLVAARAAEGGWKEEGFALHRVRAPSDGTNSMGAAANFAAYSAAVLRHTRGRRYDVVYASSARWMTAALGARVAARIGAPFYADIRDIISTDVAAVYPRLSRVATPLLRRLESYVLSRATGVSLVSPAFARYLGPRWPGHTWDIVPNGIDAEVAKFDFGIGSVRQPLERVILYAGNVGHGQALHKIVPALADRLRERHRFVVIGNGSAHSRLAAAVRHLPHVELCAAVPRSRLLARYAAADVLLVHVDRTAAFDLVLPSKLIEYAATGKPILAGVSGYAAELATQIAGTSVFPPCDAGAAAAALARLPSATFSRTAFIKAYERKSQASALAERIMSLIPAEGARAAVVNR